MISKGHNIKFPICIEKYKIWVFLSQLTLPNDSFGIVIWKRVNQVSNVGGWKRSELYSYLY